MLLTKGKGLSMIGYEKDSNNNIKIRYKCEKCSKEFIKNLKRDKINNIYCKECKTRWGIVPLEISNESGDLIDFRIESYYIINKILKENSIENSLSDITYNSELDKIKLSIIQRYFSKDKIRK